MYDYDNGRRTPRGQPAVSAAPRMSYKSFECMGTRVSFWVDARAGSAAEAALRTGEKLLHDFDRRLSRFRFDSELCALNADPRTTVEVSPLLARLVTAAVEAARRSGGLVDPTLTDAIERAGYRRSLAGVEPADLNAALAARPPASAAAPDPCRAWTRIEVDQTMLTVRRPPGLRIDSGGCGKGVAADMVARLWMQLLPAGSRFVVDCGGDIRLSDLTPDEMPHVVEVATWPHSQPDDLSLTLRGGAVATSGIGNRLWRTRDGFAHHLLDPATGRPAWTGLVSATAVAPTALEAETLAKTAVLSGPDGAERALATFGGVIVDYSGRPRVIDANQPHRWHAA